VGASFDESGHREILEGSKGERMDIRSVFLWRIDFTVMNRRASSLVWVVLDEEASCSRRTLSAGRRRARS